MLRIFKLLFEGQVNLFATGCFKYFVCCLGLFFVILADGPLSNASSSSVGKIPLSALISLMISFLLAIKYCLIFEKEVKGLFCGEKYLVNTLDSPYLGCAVLHCKHPFLANRHLPQPREGLVRGVVEVVGELDAEFGRCSFLQLNSKSNLNRESLSFGNASQGMPWFRNRSFSDSDQPVPVE